MGRNEDCQSLHRDGHYHPHTCMSGCKPRLRSASRIPLFQLISQLNMFVRDVKTWGYVVIRNLIRRSKLFSRQLYGQTKLDVVGRLGLMAGDSRLALRSDAFSVFVVLFRLSNSDIHGRGPLVIFSTNAP